MVLLPLWISLKSVFEFRGNRLAGAAADTRRIAAVSATAAAAANRKHEKYRRHQDHYHRNSFFCHVALLLSEIMKNIGDCFRPYFQLEIMPAEHSPHFLTIGNPERNFTL